MPSLHQKIDKELAAIEAAVEQTEDYLEKLSAFDDVGIQAALVSAIALNLHAFYTGAEHIFAMIAKGVDGSQPTGLGWHRQLLLQMMTPVDNVRQPVISKSQILQLDEFRRFRHVVRSNYSHQLERDRVINLAKQLRSCHHDFEAEINNWVKTQPDIEEKNERGKRRGR